MRKAATERERTKEAGANEKTVFGKKLVQDDGIREQHCNKGKILPTVKSEQDYYL